MPQITPLPNQITKSARNSFSISRPEIK